MKLSIIFMISFLIVSLLVSVIFGGYSSYTHYDFLKENTNNNLKTIANLKTNHIEQYAELKEQRAIDFSSDGFIKEQLTELYSGKSVGEVDKILYSYIKDKKMPLDKEVYEIYILDDKGEVVSEVGHEEEMGGHKEKEESNFYEDSLYLVGKYESYFTSIIFDEEFGTQGFAVSAPIIDDGKLLGIIVLKFGLNSLFEITSNNQGLGETGETYLVNKEKFLVTPSKFLKGEEKGVLVQKIETENIGNCFDEHMEGHLTKTEPIIIFLDYRGENVFGTHREIGNFSWCLIIGIEKSESLDNPIKDYIILQIVVGLIFVVLFSFIGFFTGKYFEGKGRKRK